MDVCETEKTTLTKDVAALSHKLADANYTIKKLTDDNVCLFLFFVRFYDIKILNFRKGTEVMLH